MDREIRGRFEDEMQHDARYGSVDESHNRLRSSIYNKDAQTVAGGQASELETVKNNFLIKKLGLKDGPELMEAIGKVIEIYGKSERNKYRAVVYYMLTKHFGKEAIYG